MRLNSVLAAVAAASIVGSLGACSSSEPPVVPPPPSAAFTISSAYGIAASTATVRDPNARLRYAVIVTNGSSTDEDVAYGGCWATVRLYVRQDRSGTPIFDSTAGNIGCASNDNHLTIGPEQSAQLVGYIDVSSLLAAGVPPGHYYVSILVSPNGSATPIAAGEVDLQP